MSPRPAAPARPAVEHGIGTAAFTAAGQLHYTSGGGATWIDGDVNGDGTADFAIYMAGDHTLAATDFVL